MTMARRPATGASGCGPCSRRFHQRGSVLLKQLWDGLSELEGVRLFGPPPSAPRTPTLAFTIEANRPSRSAGGWPIEESLRLTAIFTRRPSLGGWAWPIQDSFGSAVRVTRRAMRSLGSSRPCERSQRVIE